MSDKPLTPGNWKVVRIPAPSEDYGCFWSIIQPDGTERARFRDAGKMAEHFCMLMEHCERLEADRAKLERAIEIALRALEYLVCPEGGTFAREVREAIK